MSDEGLFLARFTGAPIAGLPLGTPAEPQQLLVFLGRRLGNPQRLMFTRVQQGSTDGEFFVKDLVNSHCSSYELALEMLTMYGPVDDILDSGRVLI